MRNECNYDGNAFMMHNSSIDIIHESHKMQLDIIVDLQNVSTNTSRQKIKEMLCLVELKHGLIYRYSDVRHDTITITI